MSTHLTNQQTESYKLLVQITNFAEAIEKLIHISSAQTFSQRIREPGLLWSPFLLRSSTIVAWLHPSSMETNFKRDSNGKKTGCE